MAALKHLVMALALAPAACWTSSPVGLAGRTAARPVAPIVAASTAGEEVEPAVILATGRVVGMSASSAEDDIIGQGFAAYSPAKPLRKSNRMTNAKWREQCEASGVVSWYDSGVRLAAKRRLRGERSQPTAFEKLVNDVYADRTLYSPATPLRPGRADVKSSPRMAKARTFKASFGKLAAPQTFFENVWDDRTLYSPAKPVRENKPKP